MTNTFTDTYNRDDIRRVYASFAADYRIVAEWTELHSASLVTTTISQIAALAEAQYLLEVHLQLQTSSGRIRQAAVYRVSTNASGWSADRPGDLYWSTDAGDTLEVVVFFSDRWRKLADREREAFSVRHLQGWVTSSFNGYGAMPSVTDRRYASRAYGMERTRYSA